MELMEAVKYRIQNTHSLVYQLVHFKIVAT